MSAAAPATAAPGGGGGTLVDRGRFIALEGGEGAGKSTQARLAAEALAARGFDVVLTREPGGTEGAEALRALLLDPAREWGARAEALLFAAARADHVERLIRPALAAGRWVICDRFLDSSRAYQGGAGGLQDADLLALHRIGSEGLLPDLTVLLDLPEEIAAARARGRDGGADDRIAGKGEAYHHRVAGGFDALARAEPHRFMRVSGAGEADVVHRAVMATLRRFLVSA